MYVREIETHCVSHRDKESASSALLKTFNLFPFAASYLNRTQCYDVRDATAKAIYGRMFSWLVGKIDNLLAPADGTDMTATTGIGVLDIFGFEEFKQNGYVVPIQSSVCVCVCVCVCVVCACVCVCVCARI